MQKAITIDKTGLFPHRSIPYLLCGTLLLIGTLSSYNAGAVEFQSGEIEGSFDSIVSYGVSIRTEDVDYDLVSPGNAPNKGKAKSNAGDDSNLNFENGDIFSHVVKGVHDLELRYRNYGALLRGKWWYDYELANGDRPHGHDPNQTSADEPLDDSEFHRLARFSGTQLLDAFIFSEFEYHSRPIELRLGRQVISWGESTFIQGGINTINPVDVSAFRRPGAEIREGLLPVNMAYANVAASDRVNLELFYQLEWEKSVVDGCGSYFSAVDFLADGCTGVTYVAAQPDSVNYAGNFYAQRASDREADDEGQYGLALRYYWEPIDIEFGLYYLNYHSRLPYISVLTSSTSHPAGFPLPIAGGGDGRYLIDYPEDIKLYGLSLSTTLGGWAISGEISHRKEFPIQINGNEILAAALAGQPSSYFSVWQGASTSEIIEGYDRYDVTQLQATAIRVLPQVLGASQLAMIGEVGTTQIHDLPPLSEQRYGRHPAFGPGSLSSSADPDDGYVTDTSWGYRLRMALRYSDLIGGINLTPTLAWSHDVDGYSPAPGQQFQEGRKSVGIGITADYRETYNVGLSYTHFLKSHFNILHDRDFVTLNASINF